MIGFDYTARIDPAALVAAGCAAVFRYTTRPDWPKSIARPEVLELGNIKMPLVCNFESTADRMKGAAAAGHADAVEQSGNLAALGIPPGAVRSWFSADWDVQPGDVSAVLDYLHAASDVLGGKQFVGCYGGLRAVSAAMDAGFAGWQTVAWSGGVWDARAVARQTGQQEWVGGVQVDVNQIVDLAALGAWGGPTSGDEVITAADAQVIAAAVYNYGREDINVSTGVMHNTPLGQMAHGAWVSVNDPNGPVMSRLATLEAAVKAQSAPVVDVAALAATLGPVLHPTTDVNAVVAGLAAHFGIPDPQAFADELAPLLAAHIKVTSA